jgi:polar amino acid transport system substrate-binding protein
MLRIGWVTGIVLALAACGNAMNKLDPDVRAELIPGGRLRVAVPVGPAVSATFATRQSASGARSGPTMALGEALAAELGVPVEFVVYAGSGEITTAGPAGEWDLTFVPVDDARAQVIDFGPAYALFDSTFLIRAGLDIDSIAALDQPGRKIAAVDNTTTGRAAARTLARADLISVARVDELRSRLDDAEIDAIALSRMALESLSSELPGSTILDEAFHSTATAVAVPKGHAAALARVTEFVEAAKRSGLARRALDDAGLTAARVAPLVAD